jgi:hydroxymethylbilane synthase
MKKIRVGTRGSLLARTQTGQVVEQLEVENPHLEFEIVIVKTTGDQDQSTPLSNFGFQGVFIKELEDALYGYEIDLAVHSLKDVPHQLPSPMTLASFVRRQDPRDVLISKNHLKLEDLPQGARIGTGSPRRMMQLRALRSDLNFCELRGNIDTRLSKVEHGDYDAIILAAAGLHRIGYQERISHYLGYDQMIPAIAQGTIAIETRAEDTKSQAIARSVEDTHAAMESQLERKWMERLGGGCKAPMAARAEVQGDQIFFEAILGTMDLCQFIKAKKTFSVIDRENGLNTMLLDFTKKAQSQSIPLPSELPEHALLQNFRGHNK